MKTVSDQLFRLIKSMTKSEKKYFHQFAQRHVKGQSNNYLRLFLAIEQQEVYDEARLKLAQKTSQLLVRELGLPSVELLRPTVQQKCTVRVWKLPKKS